MPRRSSAIFSIALASGSSSTTRQRTPGTLTGFAASAASAAASARATGARPALRAPAWGVRDALAARSRTTSRGPSRRFPPARCRRATRRGAGRSRGRGRGRRAARTLDESAWRKRSNTCGRNAGCDAHRRRRTPTRRPSSSRRATATVTWPPDGVNFTAFDTRFQTTCCKRSASPFTASGSSPTWSRNSTPFAPRRDGAGVRGRADDVSHDRPARGRGAACPPRTARRRGCR